MKKKFTQRIAVRVAAVFSVAVLSVCWCFLAFITANKIQSADYSAYTVTQILADEVAVSEEELFDAVDDDRFSGAVATVFSTKDGKAVCAEEEKIFGKKISEMTAEESLATGQCMAYETYLDVMMRSRKITAVRLGEKFSDQVLEDVWFLAVSSIPRKRLIFLSEDRGMSEKLYKTDSLLRVVWETDDVFTAFCGLQMGYNVCYDAEDLTIERVAQAHDAGHLIFATDVSEENYDTVIAMQADYILAERKQKE